MSANKPGYREEIVKQVNQKERQKIKAREESGMNTISWLGMIGIVGWSVTVPLLLGIAAGMWIDRRFPSGYSWTIMLLFGGLAAGCMNAWFWVKRALQLKKNRNNAGG
jgi:ATP synthase protein I